MSLKNHVEEKMKLHEPGSKEYDHYRLWLLELEKENIKLHVDTGPTCEGCQ